MADIRVLARGKEALNALDTGLLVGDLVTAAGYTNTHITQYLQQIVVDFQFFLATKLNENMAAFDDAIIIFDVGGRKTATIVEFPRGEVRGLWLVSPYDDQCWTREHDRVCGSQTKIS